MNQTTALMNINKLNVENKVLETVIEMLKSELDELEKKEVDTFDWGRCAGLRTAITKVEQRKLRNYERITEYYSKGW